MEEALNTLERNNRHSLGAFAAALIAQLSWMTGLGLLFLVMGFEFADWARLPDRSPGVDLLVSGVWLMQWVPAVFLVGALSRLVSGVEDPAGRRWALSGFWAAIGGLICGVAILLGPALLGGDFSHYFLGLAMGLVLDSLAGSLFCRAKMALIAGAAGAKREEGVERADQLSGWGWAFRTWRGTLLLQAGFLIAFTCLFLRWDIAVPAWKGMLPTTSLGLVMSVFFLVASTFWFILYSPWIVIFCLRSLRGVPTSGPVEGSTARGETLAGQAGEGKQAGRPSWEMRFVPGLVLVSSMVVAAGLLADVTWDGVFGPKRKGSVEQLKATVMIPAWDADLPEGKTVIWCATFQEAWRRLGKDVNGEAVQLEGMPEVSAELGRWQPDAQVWQGAQMVAEAGTPADGVYQRIADRMANIDPKIPTPAGPGGGPEEVAVAFGYLLASLEFGETYLDRVVEFPTGVEGKKKRVKAFGMPSGIADDPDSEHLSKLRTQCVVLYESGELDRRKRVEFNPNTEFCLDLDGNSPELQVLVARVAKPKSLREGWENLVGKMEDYRKRVGPEKQTIGEEDSVAIPSMHWDLTAEFLRERPRIVNGKLANHRIGEATQRIRFSLDKGGAEARSVGKVSGVTSLPRVCTCDRPFLIVMKNRKASVPFFDGVGG